MRFKFLWSRFLNIVMATSLIAITPAAATTTTLSPEQRQNQIDQQVGSLEGDLDEATEEEIETKRKLDEAITLQNSISDKVKNLDAEISTIQIQVFAAQADLQAAQAVFDTANTEYLTKQSEADASIQRVRDQAAEMMAGGGPDQLSKTSVLLSANSLQDLQRRRVVLEVVADKHKSVLDEAVVKKEQAKAAHVIALAARDEAQKKRDEIALSEVKLHEQRAQLANLNRQAVKSAAEQAALLEDLQGQKVEYLNRIEQLKRESVSIGELLKNRGTGGTAPGAGALGYPVENPQITSAYGWRIHPIYGDLRLHAGIDLKASTGTPVLASADGTVAYSSSMSGYGNVVIVDHGGGLATLYAHNSVLLLAVNTTVRRGETIAFAGATGNVTGPHVHYEVRLQGTPVDPMPYLLG